MEIRNEKGRNSKVAYEYIRLIPKLELTEQLSAGYVEDYINNMADADFPRPSTDSHHQAEPDNSGDIHTQHGSTMTLKASNAEGEVHPSLPLDDEVSPTRPTFDDIGRISDLVDKRGNIDGSALDTQRQVILEKVKAEIGARQVSAGSIKFAPDWLLQEAIQSELDSNWKGAYMPIPITSVPRGANLISSHLVFKVKEDDGQLRRKPG